MYRLTLYVTGLFLLVSLSGCATPGQDAGPPDQPRQLPVLRKQSGASFAVTQERVRLINSTQAMRQLGVDDLSQLNPDFDRETLIFYSLGERPTAGYSAEITGATRRDTRLVVEVLEREPGQDQMNAQVLTYPYAAAVVPKVTGVSPVVEKETTQGSGHGID